VDSKRLKAISKIIEKEDKMRAPVTKKVAQNANFLADTQAHIVELEQQVQKLSVAAS
jgi:glutamine amidotransferase PdxT